MVTLHADEEMYNDGLTAVDVENAILSGRIEERQRTGITGQWKYRVRGPGCSGDTIEVILKLGPLGAIIVTVHVL